MAFQLNTQKRQKTKEVDQEANEFASFYGRFVASIKLLKFPMHFISAISQMYGVYLIMTSNMPGVGKAFAAIMAIVVGITVGIAIEKGISTVGRVWWRVIFRFKFGNGYWIGMFAYATVILAPTLFLSPWLSETSATYSMEQIITDITPESTDSLELVAQLASDSIRKIVQTSWTADSLIVARNKRSVQAKYKALRAEQYRIYDKHKALLSEGHDWAQSHMDRAVATRKQLDIEERAALVPLEDQLLQIRQATTTRRDSALAFIQANLKRKIKRVEEGNDSRGDQRTTQRETWSSAAGYLAIFGSLGVFIIIGIEELYRAGAKQEPPSYIDEERESWLWKLRQALLKRSDRAFERAVEWLDISDPLPGAKEADDYVPPRIGFELGTSSPTLSHHTQGVTKSSNTSGNSETLGPKSTNPKQPEALYAQGSAAVSASVSKQEEQLKHLGETAETVQPQYILNEKGIPVFLHIDQDDNIKYCNLGECKRRLKTYEKRVNTSEQRLHFAEQENKAGSPAYKKTEEALVNQRDKAKYWSEAVAELEDMIALQKGNK